MSPLFPVYPPSLTAISLPGLMAQFLAGWESKEQGFKLNVCVSLLTLSPSRLDAGPPAMEPRLNYRILYAFEWCIFIPRHVPLNGPPYSPTLNL